MIPKIIHYCWFGKGRMPKSQRDCVKGWKRLMPDYQFMRWDESNFDYNRYEASKYAYEVKKYALVSDVCRYNVLAEYGGIYLDTDVEVFQRFDRFLDCNFFSGIELYREFEMEHVEENYLNMDGTPKTPGIDVPHMEILTSSMACNQGNELICKIRDYYNTVEVDGEKALHYRDWVNNDRLVARYLTEYGFRYKNETQYLENGMVVYGTGVFGHVFCPDQRYEVSWHHNAASWLDNKKQRDATFDIMKGIGILLVITCHFFGWNHPYLARSISSFHMPMFFVVAGYFSKTFSGWNAARGSIRKYFSRLILPFVFAQLAVVGWDVLMCLSGKTSWDPVVRDSLSLLWADVYGPTTSWGTLSLGVVWFLCALFVAKTLLLVIISRLKSWAVLISFALAIAAILIHKVFPYSIGCISLALTALPFVTIGWWLRNCSVPIWVHLSLIVCWLAAIKFSELDMYCFLWRLYPLDVIGALGGTSFLFLLSKGIAKYMGKIGKVFAYLGVLSLAIMCVHYFEMSSHLGNHIIALFGDDFPAWSLFTWRYLLTVGLAVVLVRTPGIKKLFV